MGRPLSITQVASTLGVSERTVYRLMQQNKLHPWKSGKSWQFDQSELETYIGELRQKSAKELEEKRGTQSEIVA